MQRFSDKNQLGPPVGTSHHAAIASYKGDFLAVVDQNSGFQHQFLALSLPSKVRKDHKVASAIRASSSRILPTEFR